MSNENSLASLGFPKLVLVFSGKRKSGKDFITDKLFNRIGSSNCVIIRLSGPLKQQYAKEHGLDYSRLLDASQYKETFRSEMIPWGEEIRKRDPSYFCLHAIIQSNAMNKSVWIVSDARRKTDLEFFKKNYPTATKSVRVSSSDDTRKLRGWVYTEGVDDAESECGLDDIMHWDFLITNETEYHESLIEPILKVVNEVL